MPSEDAHLRKQLQEVIDFLSHYAGDDEILLFRQLRDEAAGIPPAQREAMYARDSERIGLVGCSKKKRPEAAEARDLYESELFRAARAWAEAYCDRWFILSARHGLLLPNANIQPYDITLDQIEIDEWVNMASSQMIFHGFFSRRHRFVWLAGQRYIGPLRPLLEHQINEMPLAGMGDRAAYPMAPPGAGAARLRRRSAGPPGVWCGRARVPVPPARRAASRPRQPWRSSARSVVPQGCWWLGFSTIKSYCMAMQRH